tara:strand:+ start:497 stop:631 length:135 start_codon:yes stop_codon:yes gene_type:complete
MELDIFWTELETVVVEAYFTEGDGLTGFYGVLGEGCEGGEGFWT